MLNGPTRFIISKSPLKNIGLRVAKPGFVTSITVMNQSTVPNSLKQPQAILYYQYLQINGSVGNQQDNIDQYVASVTYNFSVPISWLTQQGKSASQVQLFKYYPQSQSWSAQPTTLVNSNATSYFYSANSTSLSGYVVGFSTAKTTGTSAKLTLSAGGSWYTYFYGAAQRISGATSITCKTWTVNTVQITSNEICSGTTVDNVTVISYNGQNTGSSASLANIVASTSSGISPTYPDALVGIGANVIFTNNDFTTSTALLGTSANSLTFTTLTANEQVFIIYAMGGNQIRSVTLPAGGGCQVATAANSALIAGASVFAANCIVPTAGSYTTFLVPNTAAVVGVANSIVAFGYPAYGLWLKNNPASGNILTSPCVSCASFNQQNGNVVNVIGSNFVGPVAPTGYTFSGWTVDAANSANIVLSSGVFAGSGTASNAITVMGNAILTAQYVPCGSLGNGYVVGFCTSGTTSITKPTNFNAGGSWYTYFFGISSRLNSPAGNPACNGNWQTNTVKFTSNEICTAVTGHNDNVTVIGYNGANTGSSAPLGNFVTDTVGTNQNTIIIGIGANVIFTNNDFTTSTALLGTSANSLTYTTASANEVVFILYGMSGNTVSGVTLPASGGCQLGTTINAVAMLSVYTANCITAAAGSYTTYLPPNTAAGVGYANSIAAIGFPQYGLWLKDSPGSGNILTSPCVGCSPFNQQNGNVVNVIGSNFIAPVAPTGYEFAGWTVDSANSANIILSSTGSTTNAITVMGNAILTAQYVPCGHTGGSGYIVDFCTQSATGTAQKILLNAGGSWYTYFFGISSREHRANACKTWTTNTVQFTNNEICANGQNDNVTVIGYNGANTGASAPLGNFIAATPGASPNYNTIIGALGANVIYTNNDFTTSTTTTGTSANSLTYTTSTANEVVFILFSIAGNTIPLVTLPASGGCAIASTTNQLAMASVYTANCITGTAGSYTTYLPPNTAAGVGYANSISAVGFPTYGLWLKDNPGGGNILTSPCVGCASFNQQNGNVVNVIGSNFVAPVPPAGGTFTGWSVDAANTGNIILSSVSGSTTNAITVMGNAILTATYSVPATCIPVLNTNNLITFPNTQAGTSASTSNAENILNAGTTTSNILVDGGNWVSGTLSFLQTNTLWDIVSHAGANGNELANSVTGKDTFIPVLGNSGANVFFFGLNVPQGQAAATYVETINVMLSC